MRVVTDKDCSETFQSLNEMGLEYLFNIIEKLDMRDYITSIAHRVDYKKQLEEQSKR